MLITKKVQRPWSCGSAPSQETEQVIHILIHTGFIRLTRGSSRVLPCLGIGLVTRPCDLSPKLLWGTTYKRGGTLALLTEAEPVETLMYLHLSMVFGRLLANQMIYIPLHAQWPNRIGLPRWRRCARVLMCVALRLPRRAVLLDEGSGDQWSDYLAGGDRNSVGLAEARDQSQKPQGPVGLLWVQRVPSRRHTCKQINGISNHLGHMDAIRNQLNEVLTYLCHDGITLLGGQAPCRTDRGP